MNERAKNVKAIPKGKEEKNPTSKLILIISTRYIFTKAYGAQAELNFFHICVLIINALENYIYSSLTIKKK